MLKPTIEKPPVIQASPYGKRAKRLFVSDDKKIKVTAMRKLVNKPLNAVLISILTKSQANRYIAETLEIIFVIQIAKPA